MFELLKKNEPAFVDIISKVEHDERISNDDALKLYQSASLGLLGVLADHIRKKLHGLNTFYISNVHIEPTNECVFDCLFCSYRSKSKEDAWELSIENIIAKLNSYAISTINEVHIVGGAHPKNDIYFYAEMLKAIRQNFPHLHIKAFSAIEIINMCKVTKIDFEEGLKILKSAGLDSIPGGGAEIFDETIRKKICPSKGNATEWLRMHETAHQLSIPTNATILFGHIESYEHRIDHLSRLRSLQDRTKGFQAFIPLKYKSQNNDLDHINEVSNIEVLRNYAISRIYLDNFAHIKAYWPMLGKSLTQIALSFGADDLDGTIHDSTAIYSRAGAEESNPEMTREEMNTMIKKSGFIPSERNSIYKSI